MKLAGKTAIVTGAGRNIGEEIAKLFAKEGAKVSVVDMDEGRANAVADMIKADGGDAVAVVCDVADSADIAKMVSATVDALGGIDILVNNVAISDNKDIFEITEDEWRKTIDVTLSSPFYVTKQVAKWMVDNDRGGRVVNVGSTSGFKGRPTAIAYTSAKGGVAIDWVRLATPPSTGSGWRCRQPDPVDGGAARALWHHRQSGVAQYDRLAGWPGSV